MEWGGASTLLEWSRMCALHNLFLYHFQFHWGGISPLAIPVFCILPRFSLPSVPPLLFPCHPISQLHIAALWHCVRGGKGSVTFTTYFLVAHNPPLSLSLSFCPGESRNCDRRENESDRGRGGWIEKGQPGDGAACHH